MAPPDGGLHVTLTAVGDAWSSDVSVGSPATGEYNMIIISYEMWLCSILVMSPQRCIPASILLISGEDTLFITLHV